MVAISIFLSSLGLTNARKGGIIGVDCEVIVVKIWPILTKPFATVGDQQTNFGRALFIILLVLASFVIFFILWLVCGKNTSNEKPKQEEKTQSIQNQNSEKQESD